MRVYGLLLDSNQRVLAVSEDYAGRRLTKFPGGGLEPGEGTLACVCREFKEETGLDIPFSQHFYTTDFYQESAFRAGDQILSIYYVHFDSSVGAEMPIIPEEGLEFKWLEIHKGLSANFDLPIDRLVAEKLVEAWNTKGSQAFG